MQKGELRRQPWPHLEQSAQSLAARITASWDLSYYYIDINVSGQAHWQALPMLAPWSATAGMAGHATGSRHWHVAARLTHTGTRARARTFCNGLH